jgi:hypothetical protein
MKQNGHFERYALRHAENGRKCTLGTLSRESAKKAHGSISSIHCKYLKLIRFFKFRILY